MESARVPNRGGCGNGPVRSFIPAQAYFHGDTVPRAQVAIL
jgi:hypothetical protein